MSTSTPTTQVPTKVLHTMYHRMCTARGIEDLLVKWVQDGTFTGFWHPGRGQEGAGVGLMAALAPEDQIMWYHRGAIWPTARGMDAEPILADLLGRTNGSTNGKGGGNPHWVNHELGLMGSGGTLGTAHVLAGGLALAKQVLGRPGIAVAGFGDGTAARGTFHETLMQATAWDLPLLYFCENNGWSVATPFSLVSPKASVADKGAGYGIPAERVDGQDAVAVYEAVLRAREHIVAGNGPALIEAVVTRHEGHWFGDTQQYRDRDTELVGYRDPVDILAARLDPADAERLRADALAALETAAEKALAGPIPGPETIFHNLYAE